MKKDLHPISETPLNKAFPYSYPIIQALTYPAKLFNYCCKRATPERFQDPRDMKALLKENLKGSIKIELGSTVEKLE
jgi:hypothetical protein